MELVYPLGYGFRLDAVLKDDRKKLRLAKHRKVALSSQSRRREHRLLCYIHFRLQQNRSPRSDCIPAFCSQVDGFHL